MTAGLGSWWRWSVFLFSFCSVILLFGCPTVSPPEDWARKAIGMPMEKLFLAVDRDHARDPKNEPSREDILKTRYKTSGGNDVYVIPIVFKRCNVHWEVNTAAIIVGYRYEEVTKGGCNW